MVIGRVLIFNRLILLMEYWYSATVLRCTVNMLAMFNGYQNVQQRTVLLYDERSPRCYCFRGLTKN